MRFYTFAITFVALVLYKHVSAMPACSVEEIRDPMLYKRDITGASVSHNAIIDHSGNLNGAASARMSTDGDGQIQVDDHGKRDETYHFKEEGIKSEFHSDTETGAETRDVCSTHSEGAIYPDN
jgi:hypothetical protein